ncbi:rhodanese-like domain-containing protein 10 isoform X1 [Carica papaya]|uniref:rhodanese-like domain-containing protein 10 isoform X1 n=1 Tax=Carica papaya TaxID=3649 RepID=UPI000B8CCFCA|nr:rhodanese-like domain-containing protein 10 isoform X1 [Carica papaya]
MALIEKKLLPLRPGVAKLIDQALAKGVQVAVCSTSNEKAVSAIVSCLLGPERAEKIKIFAGDVVPRKKPDPAIYLLAADTLGVDPSSCVVVEDSAIGLAAAKAAGMKCIVTKSGYTADEDFLNADAVFDCIGDPPEERFDLAFCGSLLEKQYASLTWKQQKQSNSSIFTTVELPPPKTLAVSVNTNGRQLIQSDIVRPITPKEATTIMNSEGFRLLDVRPMWEKQKAYVKDSLHVPLFVNDTDNSPITLLKKWVHFGYIGLWTGQKFTTFNPNFLAQMEAIVPDKNSKLLVACGEGLRSMMAISKLHEQGYKNLGWLVGGFSRCTDGDFLEVEGNEKLQYATIGGVSYYLLRLLILLRVVGNDAN